MGHKHCYIVFSALVFLIVLTVNGNAVVDMYLCPPSPAYFSSLGVGESFTVEVIAEADAPGVMLFAFTVTWTPEGSVEFVRPTSEYSPELAMTGFFPPSDFSRLSGIVPNWQTQEIAGSPGATPEICVFTAPAANYTGPDSLARITFKKLSASQPAFNIINATAAQYLSGSESTWVPVTAHIDYAAVDINSAMMFGTMLSQATAVIVTISGNDYLVDVAGDSWSLEMKNTMPSLTAQPVTVKAMQGGSLLSSIIITDFIRSPGWYESGISHSDHPGDSDGNGSKDVYDLVRLGQSYNSSVEEDRYDFRSDFNADGAVNLADLLIFTYYGR